MTPVRPNPTAGLQNARAIALRVIGTAILETRLNLFSPAPWVMGIVLAAFGYLAVRIAADPSSFALGWILAHDLGPLTAILLLFLTASLAHRPQRYEVTELQDSKFAASEEIIAGRWLGMLPALLVPLLLQYLTTLVGQKIYAQNTIIPLAYVYSFWHQVPSVLFLTTLAFCLVALTRVLILGAGLTGLLWFTLYFGQAYYPSVARVELSQNAAVFIGLTLGLFTLMLLCYQGRRRAKRAPVTYVLASVTALIFTATAVHALWVALAVPGKAQTTALWQRLQARNPKKNTALPNFAWTDTQGQRVALAELRGAPTLVVFFQPKDSDLLPLLKRMAQLRTDFAPNQLNLLGICFSEDLHGGTEALNLAGVRPAPGFHVVTDWGGAVKGDYDPHHPGSVVSWALHETNTPAAMLVSSSGTELMRDLPLEEASWTDLKLRLQTALKHQQGATPPQSSPLPGLIP